MGPEPGHEVGGRGTVARTPSQNDSQCEGNLHTHVDSTDPFRLLIGIKCSPFFPYHWICTRALTIRARYTHCGPDNDEGDRESSMNAHG